VKVNYSGNSATMKRDKYDFTLVNFASLIPISNQSFCFPIACRTSFLFYRPKGKGLEGCFTKKTLKKHVIEKVQVDLMELDMFRFEIIDEFLGL